MKVVTHLGLGEADDFVESRSVTLDEAFLGKRHQPMDGRQIFPITDFALLRVLNVTGVGLLSNLQFLHSMEEALDDICSFPRVTPPDETHAFINLQNGKMETDQDLSEVEEDYIIMRPWIDRWGCERITRFKKKEEVLTAFTKERESLAGSTGISSSILLSTKKKNVLWFYIAIAPPQGIIFEKKF